VFAGSVLYLLLQLGAVGMKSVTNGTDVMCAEGCNVVEKLWADKIHHTPVLLEAVLKWVARQDDSCCALNLLCGHREFRLAGKQLNGLKMGFSLTGQKKIQKNYSR
jgi:hypothetical protein